MPVFNGSANILATAVYPGNAIALFNAETVTAPATSTVACIGEGPFGRKTATFTVNWSTTPTASLTLFGSNTYPSSTGPQNGIAIASAITSNTQSVTDTSGFEFYWAQLASQSAGGALSVVLFVS